MKSNFRIQPLNYLTFLSIPKGRYLRTSYSKCSRVKIAVVVNAKEIFLTRLRDHLVSKFNSSEKAPTSINIAFA